jgi:hypothetical protein
VRQTKTSYYSDRPKPPRYDKPASGTRPAPSSNSSWNYIAALRRELAKLAFVIS